MQGTAWAIFVTNKSEFMLKFCTLALDDFLIQFAAWQGFLGTGKTNAETFCKE